MSGCALSKDQIQRAIDFHGHWCPGLAIGIRAGERVLRDLGAAEDEEVVAVVETDMCAVDGIQVLTGCTFGKGNLIYKDYGKRAFTFYRRSDNKSLRLVFNEDKIGGHSKELSNLHKKMGAGELTPEDRRRLEQLRDEWTDKIMDADLDDVFEVKPAETPAPRKARIMESLVCDSCGELTMESRTRNYMGQTLCLPCFERLEKRY